MPDPHWLREVIQNDRRRMTGNASASMPQPSSELADPPR